MSDPEGDSISGHKFIVSALHNLSNPGGSSVLDLIVHRGPAVSEYKNPTFSPGMFPTLYPFGIGGFDDAE